MRLGAYHLFEIVAWPAAVWCAIELALRGMVGSGEGIGMTVTTGIFAVLTIAACRLRASHLASPATVRPR